MAHSLEPSMPTPLPDSTRPTKGPRYRRDQFPPAPKSVRIVRLSTDAGEPVGFSAAETVKRQSLGCVFARRPAAVWIAVAVVSVAAVLAWAVLRTVVN